MIEMLGCRWECVRQSRERLTKKLTAGDPTHVCVVIADDERCGVRSTEGAFCDGELPGLLHAERLCDLVEFVTEQVVVGLEVGVDESQDRRAARPPEFHAEPAFGGELVEPRGLEIGVLSGIEEGPCRGGPGEGETGTKKSRDVRLAGGAEEHPAGSSEGGGPDGVFAPDLLKGDDIGVFGEPRDDFLDGGVTPRKSTDVVTHEAKGVH